MSDDEERLRLASLQKRLHELNALYTKFGSQHFADSIAAVNQELATIPEHILQDDRILKKLAEFDATIQKYLERRKARSLPAPKDIWAAVKAFEQQHDAQDLGNSSLLKTILREAHSLNIPDTLLEQTARQAARTVETAGSPVRRLPESD